MAADEPRSMREALAAQALEEIDGLVSRIEHALAELARVEGQMASTVAALDEGGDRYRSAVTTFSNEVRQELTEFVQRKANQTASLSVEELRATLQEIARLSFKSSASEEWESLADRLRKAALDFKQNALIRRIESVIIAVLVSGITASLFRFM